MAPWCSGLTRLPVKEEIGSSNLLGVATKLQLTPPQSEAAFLCVRIPR